MLETLNAVFEALKQLDMKPTPPNVSIMHGVYERLRAIYKELEEGEHNGRTDGEALDPGGRDGN